jgi:hypothetical protein
MMRERQIVDFGDIVAPSLEQHAWPIERLRRGDAPFVLHRNDPARRPLVQERDDTSQSR